MGLSKTDQFFGLPKKFWNWYHRNEKRRGDPDLDKESARDLHDEWKDRGMPGPDKKRERGSADPELLEWLIPWPLIPSKLGCSSYDCNNNGIPDDEEDKEAGRGNSCK